LHENPLALTETLLAVDYATDEPREIAVVWPRGSTMASAAALFNVLRRTFVPNRAISAACETDVASLGALVPWIAERPALDGQPTAYVCVHGRCDLPVHEPKALAATLARAQPRPTR
jgi:uncharacterized protein YyaL (SSP411 family)